MSEPEFPPFNEEGATAIEEMAEGTDRTHRQIRTLGIGLGLLALACGLLFYFSINATNERTDINRRLAVLAGEQARASKAAALQAKDIARVSLGKSTRVVRYLQGKVGTPGLTGGPGEIGLRGFRGATGDRGASVVGATGATGVGTTGDTGDTGATGGTGAPGATGATGDRGPPVGSFSFTIGVQTFTCTDSDGDGHYDCV